MVFIKRFEKYNSQVEKEKAAATAYQERQAVERKKAEVAVRCFLYDVCFKT